jgi:archaemetzincin
VKISLRPLGDVPRDVLQDLAEDLQALGTATILEPLPLGPATRDDERGQHRAEPLLEVLSGGPGDRVLGVTAADLYTGVYGFIFGLARIQGTPAVISLARLGTPDPSRFRERVAKEAVHEIGHTLGADNCPNGGCVMSKSDSVEAVDRKTRAFCGRCSPTIEFTLKRLRT